MTFILSSNDLDVTWIVTDRCPFHGSCSQYSSMSTCASIPADPHPRSARLYNSPIRLWFISVLGGAVHATLPHDLCKVTWTLVIVPQGHYLILSVHFYSHSQTTAFLQKIAFNKAIQRPRNYYEHYFNCKEFFFYHALNRYELYNMSFTISVPDT